MPFFKNKSDFMAEKEQPYVSVIIAVKNEGDTMKFTLDALKEQTYPHDRFEVIIVDGGSTDGTVEYVQRYVKEHDGDLTIRHIAGIPHMGPSDARNAGVLEAKGEIVAFTDADCIPVKNWLADLVPPYSDPEIGGVGGGLRYVDLKNDLSRLEDIFAMANYHGFITSNMSFRKSAFEQIGMFDITLKCAEDADAYLRMKDAGWRIAFVPSAEVFHDPPENGSWYKYTKKQFWFSKSDAAMQRKRLGMLVEDHRANGHRAKLDIADSWPYFEGAFFPAAADWFLVTGVIMLFVPSLAALGIILMLLSLVTYGYFIYPKITSVRDISERVRYDNRNTLYAIFPFYVFWATLVRGFGSSWGWLRLGLSYLARPFTRRAPIRAPAPMSEGGKPSAPSS